VEPPGSPADQPNTGPDVIRVPVRYVSVPTTVLDPDGHGYVNGLNTTDFELLDNGVPQKISADFSEQPLSVVLAVQANADVEPILPEIRKSGVLLQGLVTGTQGDMAVLAFDHRRQVLQDFTNDPEKLSDAIQKVRAGSSVAALVDAVLEADHMLKRHDPQNVRRRVIVLLSRNVDTGSEAHLRETVRDMQFDNVIVYPIDISKFLTSVLKKTPYPRPQNGGVPPEAIGDTRNPGANTETSVIQKEDGNWLNAVPPVLHSIHDLFRRSPAEAFADFTGGRTYSFATQRTLEDAITDIGKDLNSQYLLSYSPNDTKDAGFHTIKVIVDRPGLKIRTRPGYWLGPQQ
jgi:VWFA-related protein